MFSYTMYLETITFIPISAIKSNLSGSWDHLYNTNEDNLQYILTRFVLNDSLYLISAKTNVNPSEDFKLFFLIYLLYGSFLAEK